MDTYGFRLTNGSAVKPEKEKKPEPLSLEELLEQRQNELKAQTKVSVFLVARQ